PGRPEQERECHVGQLVLCPERPPLRPVRPGTIPANGCLWSALAQRHGVERREAAVGVGRWGGRALPARSSLHALGISPDGGAGPGAASPRGCPPGAPALAEPL